MTYPIPPGPDPIVDLVFELPASAPSGPDVTVDLVFGAEAPAGEDSPITVLGRFALRGSVLTNVDAGVHRGVSQQTALVFEDAATLPVDTTLPWNPTPALTALGAAPWDTASPFAAQTAAAWNAPDPLAAKAGAAWGQAPTDSHQSAAIWAEAAVQRMLRALAWDAAQAAGGSAGIAWDQASYQRHRADILWGTAAALPQKTAAPWDKRAAVHAARLLAPWDTAAALPTCRSGPAYVRPAPVVPPPQGTTANLRFCGLAVVYPPGSVPIIFGLSLCGSPGALAILPARFYMQAHTLQAFRLPDMAPVLITEASVSSDVGSYGWTFSASGPTALFEQLAPTAGLPAQIRIELDGIAFEFLVDSITRTERFGQRGARIAGRSVTALLARPFARETQRLNATAANAQQLAEAALQYTGVSLDWGLTDWLVPAGAWSHSGTPLAAVQAIVEAAGGHLQSARAAATLLARHPYPTLAGGLPGGPWNWYASGVTPDVLLAPDALITTSIERTDQADINAVYVSGQTQGVFRFVKRTGTAGEKLAGMVTDALITANAAALQRGTAVLGAAGPKHMVTLELPVLTGAGQPGVLDVGQLVQVNETAPWRGRVRAVSASGTFGRAVRQNVQLERHLEIASS